MAAKTSHASNFVRSAMAPAIKPTVRQANIAWKATKIIAGTLASGSSAISPSRPKYSVTLPSRPAWPYDAPKAMEYPKSIHRMPTMKSAPMIIIIMLSTDFTRTMPP